METRRRVSPEGSVPGVRSPGVQWPAGLLLRVFRVSSFLLCLRGLYWARRIADNYTVCCSRVHKAWPVSYYTVREENMNLVAAWLSAFAGVFPISPMVPAELGRGGWLVGNPRTCSVAVRGGVAVYIMGSGLFVKPRPFV